MTLARIQVGSLEGQGNIQANGGGPYGGGGGRVAVYYGDRIGFSGRYQARGGATAGGAGTVYLKKDSDANGELIIDNGGLASSEWSTPLFPQWILRLNSWTISGNARVSTTDGVRVANGNPAQFAELISSNYLQVGGLLVSNTWVFGDVMDLEIRSQKSKAGGQEAVQALVTVYCRPQKTYLLLASTNFLDWIPVTTNTPAGSRFDYLDTEAPLFSQRYFRAVMIEHLFDGIRLSQGPANRVVRLAITNVQPTHTLVVSTSEDLRHWIPLNTNTPITTTNWLLLDTNAPSFDKRFYRVWGLGK